MIISSFVIYGLPDDECARVFEKYIANCSKSFAEQNELPLTFSSMIQEREENATIEFKVDKEALDKASDDDWNEFINTNYGE